MRGADALALNDWYPVGASSQLGVQPQQVCVLGQTLVVWRDAQGRAVVMDDRCPHRGAALSLGQVRNGHLSCPYHGWQFDAAGQCQLMPACPQLTPSQRAHVQTYACSEAYGLLWVCLGPEPQALPLFPEYAHAALQKVVCGPYEVAATGPRIIENFLDMAHFGFVHEGILGDLQHPVVADYEVQKLDCLKRGQGLLATSCRAWQPQANLSLAAQGAAGSWVDYSYRVVRPLTAVLTKKPELMHTDYEEAIALFVQPVQPRLSKAWVVLALDIHDQSEQALRDFQDTIFMQDKPIVESQRPHELPLHMGLELSQASDRLSMAYRRYLLDMGWRWGVIPPKSPRPGR